MKNLLAFTVLAGAALLAAPSGAKAAFMPTTSTFFTTSSAGTFTFTYLGHSADDTDTMRFTFNNQLVFVNNTSPVGTQVSVNVAGAGTYKLSLVDSTVSNTWSSDPTLNSDRAAHLSSTSTFSDFNLGALPAVAGNSPLYYGWEDRASPGSDADFNDLVFTEKFTAVPEPLSLALVGSGLVGVGIMRRRKKA